MWTTVIIDDDKKVLQGLKNVIPWEELGLKWVGEAVDGKKGLELIRLTRPDIVLTDIYMPVMNGFQMIKVLREENLPSKIVILSGYADFENARNALQMNVIDFLSKPSSVQSLRQVLERVVAKLYEDKYFHEQQKQLHSKLFFYESYLANEWIKSVVTGTVKTEQMGGEPVFIFQTRWEAQTHLVLGIELKNQMKDLGGVILAWNQFRLKIGEAIAQIASEANADFEYVEIHSHHSVIVLHFNKKLSKETIIQQIRQLCEKIQRGLLQRLQLQIEIGVGRLKMDWKDIAQSTEEAFYALAAKISTLHFSPFVFEYGQTAVDDPTLVTHTFLSRRMKSIKYFHEFGSAMSNMQKDQAEISILALVGEFSKLKKVKPSQLRALCMELWAILAYSLYDIGINLDETFPDVHILDEVEKIDTPDQLIQWMQDKIEHVCENYAIGGNSKHKQIVSAAVQYIQEHYAQEITLNELAEKLYISKNYLGQIFKNSMGETFNQYLTRIRMEKSKNMLLEGKYFIYEIAEKVGYRSIPYFTSLFKKYIGVNPSDLIKSKQGT